MRKRFGVYIEFKANFTPVNFHLYCTWDYEHAFTFFDEKVQTRKRRYFVKELGYKHRWYDYDERYAEMLATFTDPDPDEFYEEPTADDQTIVQLHQPDRQHKVVRAVWRSPQMDKIKRISDEYDDKNDKPHDQGVLFLD